MKPFQLRATLYRNKQITFAALGLLFIVVVYDLSHPQSIVRKHAQNGAAYVQANFKITKGAFHDPTNQSADDEEVCRVQFVFAGSKYDYNNFPTLQSWIRYTDPKCQIDFLRPNHPLLKSMNLDEKRVLQDMAYLPILQADFMKLLAIYYLGGVSADLDVEALKPFPSDWVGPHTALSTCDVVLGSEATCFDDECVKGFARKGQIQNWVMYSRRKFSPFLGDLIEFIVENYYTFPHHDKSVSVQDVAGSGIMTDYFQMYGNFSVPHYEVQTTPDGGTLQTNLDSILRLRKHHEEICLLGYHWTGGGCNGQANCMASHHFEGSWKGL